MSNEGRLLTRDWTLYDTSHVVYRPGLLSPDRLQDGYLQVLEESFTWSSIFRRLWGTTAWKHFFYGMNFGYRQSVKTMLRCFERNVPSFEACANPAGSHPTEMDQIVSNPGQTDYAPRN
jgi:hypothetical protein